MKKLFTLKNVLIGITFTVFLLFIKDNLNLVGQIFSTIGKILTPFLIGFLFAYILNYPYKFFYSKVFGKMGKKRKIFKNLKKPLAIICTYVLVIAVIVVLVSIVVPQFAMNITSLFTNMPGYAETLIDNINNIVNDLNKTLNLNIDVQNTIDNLYTQVTSYFSIDNLTKVAGQTTSAVLNMVSNTANGFYNFIMGIVISVYFLAAKEMLCRQVKKLAVAFIPIKFLPKVYEIVDITDTKCGRYLVGNIIDSSLIGFLTFIIMSIFQLPYAPLISVIIGVTNIILFFGPFIGAIPSAFILLLINPWDMLWFIIIIVIIQQLDGNIFNPKIIGNQVGLSSFWVLFSVTVGGALFGIPGFILATPIFAVIYSLVKKKVKNNINDKGKIAKEALDFEVLNYAKIAEQQKKIREEKENQQKEKLMKIIGFNKNSEDDLDNDNTEDNSDKDKE